MKVLRTLVVVSCLFFQLSPSVGAADVLPPALFEWTGGTRQVDITSGDVEVKARFILTDDSRIELPVLLLKSTATTQTTGLASVRQTGVQGRLKTYEATVVVKKGQSPRDWEWILYPLRDEFGNTTESFVPIQSEEKIVVVLDSVFTAATKWCEYTLKFYNQRIERLLNLEKEFPQFRDDFDAARLKWNRPWAVQSLTICQDQVPVWASGADSAIFTLEGLDSITENLFAKIAAARDKAAAESRSRQAEEVKKVVENRVSKIDSSAPQKKVTISCVKGKVVAKITAKRPKCPKGFKKSA